MLKIGDILQNRYRILDRLGEGGMGAVYRAEDTKRFNKTVALKEVLVDLASKNPEHFRRAFEREAKILTQIEHEAVPKVVDYFLETNCQFLVMELIEGEDLTSILQKRQTWFPLENVLNWANQLLDALDYLHTLNPPIIHRDIKPQNLKLTSRGRIKLLDFGIAKDTDGELSATLTDHTFIAATLHYSPFEQLVRLPFYYEPLRLLYGEKVERVLLQSADARSDIYSLGATLYHLLTNVEPPGAYHRTLEVWAGKFDPLQSPHKIAAHVSPEVSLVLLKAMEIERENRYNSALEMKTALLEIVLQEKRRDYEEDQAIFFGEQEKLRREREELDAERIILKVQHEESLRQIAAERERQKIEKVEKEREHQLYETERLRLEEQERERRRLEEEERNERERQRLEAEREENLRQIAFERERQRLEEEGKVRELRRREEEAGEREIQRLEEEANKEREREELEATRRRIEAERRWLKVQHEESLRQIAAERDRVRVEEEEEKSRELERLEEERRRIEMQRKQLEEAEQERERQRLEEDTKKERERREFEAERENLEVERRRLEAEKERERNILEEQMKKEREELEAKYRLEAEQAEKERQIAFEFERQQIETEKKLKRQQIEEEKAREENLRLIAFEREQAGKAEVEKQRLAEEEKAREKLKAEERERAKLEAERQKLEEETENERKREAEQKERELLVLAETEQINSGETLTELPAEESSGRIAATAQVSPFVTQTVKNNFDSAETAEEVLLPEVSASFNAAEIVSNDDEILEIKSAEEKILQIETKSDIQEIEVEFEKPEIAPVAVVAAETENSFLPSFAVAPERKAVWILPVIIIGLLVFGVGAFGVWVMSGNSGGEKVNNSAANTAGTPTPSAALTASPDASPENEPTPSATPNSLEKTKPTIAPTQNKTPVQNQVKTSPTITTPKPTQDPNCVFTNSCK